MKRLDRQITNTFGNALVLDVETTGLNPAKDEIVEFALIFFSFDAYGTIIPESVEEFTGLREPSRPIPPEATRIHGLTVEDVAGHRLDVDRIRHYASQADYYIAHNAAFDRPFVQRLFEFFSPGEWLCTMRDINWRAQGVTSRSLSNLARHFGIPHNQAHRALHDARATVKLLTIMGSNGTPFLAELLGVRLPPAGHAPAN